MKHPLRLILTTALALWCLSAGAQEAGNKPKGKALWISQAPAVCLTAVGPKTRAVPYQAVLVVDLAATSTGESMGMDGCKPHALAPLVQADQDPPQFNAAFEPERTPSFAAHHSGMNKP